MSTARRRAAERHPAVCGHAASAAASSRRRPAGGPARIAAAFESAAQDGRAALIPYAVAGYPDAETSLRIALAQIDAGADLLEIGLPYSDPLADGATLQRASTVALRHGARLDDSIELVGRIHAARPDTPLVAMGYVNQVLGGRDGATVLRRLGEAGVSGFILADLTPDEGADARGRGRATRHRHRLPRGADHAGRASRLRGVAQPGLPLRGLAGRRHRCPQAPAAGRARLPARRAQREPGARRGRASASRSRPTHVSWRAVADGIIVASALVDALGPDGTDIDRMAELVRSLREATARA